MIQSDRIASLEVECAKLRSENDKLRAIIERREVHDATLATVDGPVSTTSDASVRSRTGIDRKQRSILNIAMLTALNRPAQLRNHVEGALNNGCTPEELREILLHTAVYCGLPAATDAFRVAEEVLKARKLVE